jgi:hypothetical protein
MSSEVARFLPLAGLLVGLVVAFALDPAAERVAWWAIPAGLIAGYAVRYGMQRYGNARR